MHASRVVCTVICQSPFLVQVPCNKLFILLLSHHHAARSMSSQVIVVSASDSVFASGIRETSASHKMFCFLRFVKESFSFLRANVDRSCHEAGPVKEDLFIKLAGANVPSWTSRGTACRFPDAIKTKGENFIILALYVDDILLASNDKNIGSTDSANWLMGLTGLPV